MWSVAGDGVIHRTMHMGPLVCITDSFSAEIDSTIDGEFVEKTFPPLGECHVIANNDHFAVVEATPLRDLASVLEPGKTADLVEVGHFMRQLGATVPYGGAMLNTPFMLRFDEAGGDWGAVVRESQAVADSVIAASRIIAAIEMLDGWGAKLAARVLAAALRLTDLAAGPLARGPVTAFVPDGDAVRGLDGPALNRLLMPGNERSLARAVLQCCVRGSFLPGDLARRQREFRSLAGPRLGCVRDASGAQQIGGATIIDGPRELPGVVLYRTDAPVWTHRSAVAPRGRGLAEIGGPEPQPLRFQ